ncbi:hypothetical protein RND81_09G035700 [Saponaria officinalis]|uniref:CCHC-type domain-containing protein n=1 Tax=Saponaria officinalis TaxID=3572 RepID=A0AAW1II96_SAPOF
MDKVSVVPIWVLLPGLDPYLWSDIVLSKIASKIGTPLFADKTTTCQGRLSFARMLVEPVEYEWIPYYCSECGKLGHEVSKCRVAKAKAKVVQPKVICNYTHHSNGRIWVVWNPATVYVRALEVHSQFIHGHILHHSTCMGSFVTFTYASNDSNVRRDLWSSLNRLIITICEWMVLGDFNVVRTIEEQLNDTPPCLSDLLDFNACFLHFALEDLQSSGCGFTWTNKQANTDKLWCKLDRALANHQWLAKFPATSVCFLAAGISDHSPVAVAIFQDMVPRGRFSFLNCWISEPFYSDTVQAVWAIHVPGSVMFRFFGKLRNVRKALQAMHKQKFSSVKQRASNAKQQLEECQVNLQLYPMATDLIQEEK